MNLEEISSILVNALSAFETALRRLNPLAIAQLREELLVHEPKLTAVREFLLAYNQDAENINDRKELLRACDLITNAIRNFGNEEDLEGAFISALRAARKHCRAQEALFSLCETFPAINRYFLETQAEPASLTGKNSGHDGTGIFHERSRNDLHARGGYSLYIPDAYTPEHAWPLIIALHGGYSHGKDFIWTWLREARSRGYILFAPTSTGMSWSITNVEKDAQPINKYLEDVCSRVNIDRSRILLTGMSNGGTYALELALAKGSIYRVVAPVACALPPVDLLEAEGKRILWVHGAQDWIFTLNRTIAACKELQQAGADIKLKVIQDLSHTYPREENDTILRWFEKLSA